MVVQDSVEEGNTRMGVQLEPFLHQVGGHLSVMKYDEDTVCKPLVSQEQRFYESLPLAMKRFTPQYKGTITVHLRKDSLGHLSLVANPLKENQGPLNVPSGSAAVAMWQKLQQTTSSGGGAGPLSQWQHAQLAHSLKESPATEYLRSEFHLSTHVSSLVEDAKENQDERRSFNPWGLHCHQAHLTRLCTEYPENKPYRFLLLENVVSQYKHPCVLDLKMGTRQHGDDASEEKKARQMTKCAQSTSACLGVRVCGMQVYQTDKKHFLCKDKYYGRKLSVEGFRQALYQFLHDGTRLRTELLGPIRCQLQALLLVIRSQSSYRFYSSSLLIIYDGQEPLERAPGGLHPQEAPQTTHGSSPRGFPKVDIRMIDFAHTTYKGSRNEHTTYDGPDPGYIFGLQNLIQILQDIQE
ncbi:inositol hexakisphosphate kinase 3 [Artibeus jamaicensis]|uniref:inositol hexakisphosphate kinase 3 n=1 Tax=Artibeus jamaicensis TaxID=9417 RepID=UPI00235B019B|nr:inositol hexakisphosphate kinase 3 [Artibeus jamaicensis]XP_053524966.1 inositol hexakisphosphate kinase 3 [Artibeus jamaicensis]XP_053524968.1 inositol hexakisphosphate kinase 3 [Artibeus jamaicensis]XP_053524971.1 inositol hexakisphosphate kinase 3 [Artibeus jamaicensis]